MLILCGITTDVVRLESTAEQLEFLRALLMPHCEVTATIGKKQDEGQSQ